MRLLFLSDFYPPHDRGGFENLCQEVAVELQKRGHTVQILTSQYGVSALAKNTNNGVLRWLHLQADIFHYRPADFFLRRPFQEKANARALRRAINQYSPELLVVWGMWNLSRSLPYWAEQWLPGRVAYYVSDTWPVTTDIHEQYWRLPARRRFSELLKGPVRSLALGQLRCAGYPPPLRFERAVCCSQFIRDMLVGAGKLPPSTGVLFHGINPEQFLQTPPSCVKTETETLRFLYFGRLVPDKGVHTAIEALGLLKQQGCVERIALTILGSGHPEYEDHLRALVTQLGVGDHVQFTGRVSWEELLAQLKSTDVVLFTSIGPEAMARTVMEAMAAGVLVIGTPAGGQKEMLCDGENALVFQADDPASLAQRITYVLDAPAVRCRLAQAGQQVVLERFTLQRMADDMEAWLHAMQH